MNREEAIAIIRKEYLCVDRDCDIERNCGKCDLMMPSKEPILEAYKMAIKALEQMPVTTTAREGGVIYYPQVEGVTPTVIDAGKQEPCDNAVSRQDVLDLAKKGVLVSNGNYESVCKAINELPSVNPQPCEDAISRTEVIKSIDEREDVNGKVDAESVRTDIVLMQPVNPQPKTEHCKDCKHFEYDSVARVDGIPLIVAHEICSRWGDGCKTSEDGYCFLFEPQERSDKE